MVGVLPILLNHTPTRSPHGCGMNTKQYTCAACFTVVLLVVVCVLSYPSQRHVKALDHTKLLQHVLHMPSRAAWQVLDQLLRLSSEYAHYVPAER